MPSTNHRKLVKHFDLPGHAHELKFSCYRRFPLLLDDRCKVLLSQAIDRAMTGQGYRLLAFVYMPEHVHLLVMPNRTDASISSLLSAVKRPSSYRIKLWMQQQGDPMLERLMILERPGKTTYRFWQEGSGYDRNITESVTLGKVVDYLHANPVRRGLVATESHWHWSSWHHYHGDRRADQNLPTVHDCLSGW